jgi:hypothetical protein
MEFQVERKVKGDGRDISLINSNAEFMSKDFIFYNLNVKNSLVFYEVEKIKGIESIKV